MRTSRCWQRISWRRVNALCCRSVADGSRWPATVRRDSEIGLFHREDRGRSQRVGAPPDRERDVDGHVAGAADERQRADDVEPGRARRNHPRDEPDLRVTRDLEPIQRQLFQVGAELATLDLASVPSLSRIEDSEVASLESLIDRMESELSPLKNFVLPAGTPLAAQLHVARTVCRRAERRIVSLAATESIEPRLGRYLNRLGDMLFVMARWCNHRAGVGDSEWRPQ